MSYKLACQEIMQMLRLLREGGVVAIPMTILIPTVLQIIMVCTIEEKTHESG